MITTEYDKEENVLTCVFSGKMDALTSSDAAARFEQSWREAQANAVIVFDLAAVTFLASAFLRICLQAAKMAGHDSFKIVNTPPHIHKVFHMAGLDKFIR